VVSKAITARLAKTFAEVLALPERPVIVAVDMPVGLLDAAVRGGRACDKEARALLGWPRASSVFTPPVRAAFGATTYRAASAANRASSPARLGITVQTFGILRKLEEVDRAMTPARQSRVFEVHPELSFLTMAGRPAHHAKKSTAGRSERRARLAAAGFSHVPMKLGGAAADDVLDAAAACWSALRIQSGIAARLPDGAPPLDARGLRMEIWR
jgi:predicted RNase H-like nuclease